MARTLPFHTVKEGTPAVFHNNDSCFEGRHTDPEHWRAGDGNRALCAACAQLNAAEHEGRQAQ